MSREARRVIAVDCVERFVGRAGGQVVEHTADPAQQLPAALERLDRIGEVGSFAQAGDGRDFGSVLGHAAVEGRREMLRRDPVERRQFERSIPGLEERAFGHPP